MGNPPFFQFIGRYFAAGGYKTAIAGCRSAPFHDLANQTGDVLNALEAAFGMAGNGRVAVVGQSSGAHLSALAVFDRDALLKRGLDQERVSALVAISGPLDLSRLRNKATRQVIQGVLGDASWSEADPIRLVRGDERVPVLCIHGSRDPMVDLACSQSFVDRINQIKKGQAALILAHGHHHADLVTLFMKRHRTARAMNRWLAKHSP